jgi:hypothetical protein
MLKAAIELAELDGRNQPGRVSKSDSAQQASESQAVRR